MPTLHPQLANEPNVAFEFVSIHSKVCDNINQRINEGIEQLTELNQKNRALQRLLTGLNCASDSGKGADFTNDREMRETIDAIYEFAPEIFGHVNGDEKYQWKANEINKAVENIAMQVDAHMSASNQIQLFMKLDSEARGLITESAKDTLNNLIRHNEKIIARYKTP